MNFRKKKLAPKIDFFASDAVMSSFEGNYIDGRIQFLKPCPDLSTYPHLTFKDDYFDFTDLYGRPLKEIKIDCSLNYCINYNFWFTKKFL